MNIIEQIINDPEGGPYEWLQVVMTVVEMHNRPLAADERVWLEKGKTFVGLVNLAHGYDGPHRKPPDYFIRRFCNRLLELN